MKSMNTVCLQFRVSGLAVLLVLPLSGCGPTTPPTLTEALKDSRLETVNARLKNGADVNEQDAEGRTVLHAAAFHGELDSVTYLLERSADLNLRTTTGYTPLHAAVMKDKIAIVELLLQRGANVNTRRSKDGRSPLDCARSEAMTKLLLSHGAKPGAELK